MDRFDPPQQKYVTTDPQNQKSCCADKRAGEGMCRLYDIARKNRRSNPGKLIAEIENSSERANAFSRRNQRRDRPSHR